MNQVKSNVEFKKGQPGAGKEKEKEILHEMKAAEEKKGNKLFIYLGVFLVVGIGVVSGYFLAMRGGETVLTAGGGGKTATKAKNVVGSADTKTFKDSAEGKLKKGGIDGEGSHKLIRPGGASQTVYLTSSVIDLDDYVGKKVKVWGETFAAEKAGWLMDVGRLEVL